MPVVITATRTTEYTRLSVINIADCFCDIFDAEQRVADSDLLP